MRHLSPFALVAALLLPACASCPLCADSGGASTPETLSGSRDLLKNGLSDWRSYGSSGIVGSGWSVSQGILHLPAESDSPDLATRAQFGDFDLSFEYLCPENGTGSNSGVMYRVSQDARNSWWNGMEYQVLGTAYAYEGKPADDLHATGSVYGFYPTKMNLIKPDGQWNSGRIVAEGTHIEHWLNGVKVAEYDTASKDYAQKLAESKFRIRGGFGQNAAGYIVLQNHMDEVFYRNIVIKPVK